jgi:OFA family oxalate/formate antiporter-like MFS transporter
MFIFRLIGIVYSIIVIICATALANPKDFAHKEKQTIPIKDFIKQRKFLLLLCGISAGTFPGLMIIGNLKPICLSFGFSVETAAMAITFIAIGNAIGRIKWGGIYDKLQKKTIDLLLLTVIISTVLILTKGFSSSYFILFLSFLVGLSYGGCLSVFAAHTANEFTEKYFSVVYPFILTAHGICAPFSSTIAGYVYDKYNSYQPAIIIAAVVSALGLVAVIIIGRKLKTIEINTNNLA